MTLQELAELPLVSYIQWICSNGWEAHVVGCKAFRTAEKAHDFAMRCGLREIAVYSKGGEWICTYVIPDGTTGADTTYAIAECHKRWLYRKEH